MWYPVIPAHRQRLFAVMRKLLLILCWSLALPGALLALLIILPAPAYYLWMAAVVASEWSVWLLVAGLISLVCGIVLVVKERRSLSVWINPALSLLMIVCASLPVIEAYRVAAQEGVRLSLSRYLFGLNSAPKSGLIEEQHDVEFARPAGTSLR